MTSKRSPTIRIVEKIAPLVVELMRLGFEVKTQLNIANEGKVEWEKRKETKQ